jgi:Zn-dependent protease
MAIHFACPWCTQTISVDESKARERVECPHCNRPVKVPLKSTEDPPPVSQPPGDLQPAEERPLGRESQPLPPPQPAKPGQSATAMKGAFPLFRVAGIRVYLHFTWFIIAALDVTRFADRYHNPIWAVFEYLALFGIVLLHEFGHALACRQTGGQADTIVLWPLGGIAFVKPPPRPGAYIWSIAAGPLVNAVLFPLLTFLAAVAAGLHWKIVHPDLYNFVVTLFFINGVLLFFNLIPVYPLDGGQIVRGLLWLKIGPIRSLKAASIIGFAGAILFALWAFTSQDIWLGILAFFIFAQARAGWRAAQNLALESEKAARRDAAISPPPSPEQQQALSKHP